MCRRRGCRRSISGAEDGGSRGLSWGATAAAVATVLDAKGSERIEADIPMVRCKIDELEAEAQALELEMRSDIFANQYGD